MTVSELIQVISFLLLAGLTAWYAFQTHRLADLSEKATEAAQSSARAAERLLMLEFTPVVWGVASERGNDARGGYSTRFLARNVGRGVALSVRAAIQVDGEDRGEWIEITDKIDPLSQAKTARESVSDATFRAIEGGRYSMICEYSDASGRRFRSAGGPTSGGVVELLPNGDERRLFPS